MRILGWTALLALGGFFTATASAGFLADASSPLLSLAPGEECSVPFEPTSARPQSGLTLRGERSLAFCLTEDKPLSGVRPPLLGAEALPGQALPGLEELALTGELVSPLKFAESLVAWGVAEQFGPAAPTAEELRGPIPEAGSIFTGLALITASFCSLRAISRRN